MRPRSTPHCPGDDHGPYAGSERALNHFLSILLKRSVRQIHSDINYVVRFIHFDWPQPVNFDEFVQLLSQICAKCNLRPGARALASDHPAMANGVGLQL
jgi:hypothetical protein